MEQQEKPVVNLEEIKEKASKTLGTMLDYLGLDATVKVEERNGLIALDTISEDAGRIIGKKGQTLQNIEFLLNRMCQKIDMNCPRIVIDVDGYSRKDPRSRRGPDRGDRPDDGGERPFRRGGDRGGRGERRGGERRGERGERGERPRRPPREGDDRPDRSEDNEERLRLQAQDAAKEVRRWGEPVVLPAMNAHDRRVIHMTLRDEADIITESQPTREDDDRFKTITISLKEEPKA